ncbi:BglG family transcription antiterminator [Rossellomorea marisflavi]|uniref:BglG family transcription antiterminator n=1 Tax=Rossellomorea marisflavi TaxID=189381 RepID=UPI003FA06EC8
MNTRFKRILKELMAIDGLVTGSHLAGVSNVSSRTVREDVKQLNECLEGHGAVIRAVRGRGYTLEVGDDAAFRTFLQELLEVSTDMPVVPEQRVGYLIRCFLQTDGYLKIQDLADEIHVSFSTLQNDLKDVKDILSRYHLHLVKKPNYGLKVEGEEVNVRFCLAEYVIDRTTPVRRQIQTLPDLHDEERLALIWTVVEKYVDRHGLQMSDIAMNNLVIHIAIACKRMMSGNLISAITLQMEEILKEKEYIIAGKMVEELNEELGVCFPQVEIAYIALHLLGTRLVTEQRLEVEYLQDAKGEGYAVLVDEILRAVEQEWKIRLTEDEELRAALLIHLKPAINRFRYGMNIRNPLLDDIKKNYPVAFEAGVVAGRIIDENMEVQIDENEIGYLALHLGAAMERQNLAGSGPKRVIIVCASGAGSARMIKYKLQSKFRHEMDVVATTEYYHLKNHNLDEIDFIISSIPLEEDLPIPVIHVRTILSGEDYTRIQSHLDLQPHSHQTYLRRDCLWINEQYSTKEDVLSGLTDKLVKKGLVDPTFFDSVMQREEIASTSFGPLLAVPHPISPQWNETFLAICSLEKPVLWNGEPVQLVCVLNVKKESTEDLQMVYAFLTDLVENQELVQRCLKSQSVSELWQILTGV